MARRAHTPLSRCSIEAQAMSGSENFMGKTGSFWVTTLQEEGIVYFNNTYEKLCYVLYLFIYPTGGWIARCPVSAALECTDK